MKAPEKIYMTSDEKNSYVFTQKRSDGMDIEYVRADAFIKKACEFLFQYNKNQVLKHGVKTTLSCVEYTINVDEFRKYMEGE